ncbi:hypothetical protein VKT23_000862 [Stygiomarasmius scandens]|uniref:Uncharacterized protein n=1 Tax=Marasmiellus scandens TaxID=2682957 RepID=A0ABR1K6C4_9AGAR
MSRETKRVVHRPLHASVLVPSTNLPRKPSPSLVHSIVDSSVTLSSRITLSFSGETFVYDLRSLQADPHEIIELLRTSASERGNWMTVAAHYRRSGNASASISILTELLKVMAQHHVPEQDLKPVFLLLSGCESDLGKHKDANSDHYRNAQKWLQKVYGRAPVPPTPVPVSIAPRASPPSRPDSTSLERQVQSLRDRLNNHVTLLSESQSSKRKLEDDFNLERDVRRKLERQVDDLRKEREQARDMESYALEQLRREVESRRRAEDHVRELQVDLERYARPIPNYYRRI